MVEQTIPEANLEREPTMPEAPSGQEDHGPEPALVEVDLLIEDVSIDGMCGVY